MASEGERGDRLTLAEILDAAEALWLDEIRERVLVERQVVATFMAASQSEDVDADDLPDVDQALSRFAEWLHSEIDTPDDLTPEDEQRIALGLPRKR